MPYEQKTIERFWAKANRVDSSCWDWLGARNELGYGQVRIAGKTRRAHRVAVEISGRHIPPGHEIDHRCHNRGCVRPDHLQVVSRGYNCGQAHREATHCPHGHPYSGANLYINPRGERNCRVCVRRWQAEMRERQRAAKTTKNDS